MKKGKPRKKRRLQRGRYKLWRTKGPVFPVHVTKVAAADNDQDDDEDE